MSARDLIGAELVDSNGSFARMLREAPKVMRAELKPAVQVTCFALGQRIKGAAPVGPDAPHIKDAVTFTVRGLTGRVGYIDATEPAGPDNPATQAEVALYNEYHPNKQPFMKPSAEAESADFVKRMQVAIGQVERNLSGGGGLL